MAVNVQDLLIENEFLRQQGWNHRAYTQDLADYILPRKAWITTMRTKGEQLRFNFLYDSTAIRSLRDAASNFHTNLNDASSRWFTLETTDKELMRLHAVRQYFKDVEDELFAILSRSNYYNVIQEFYVDYIGFGTSTFSLESDTKNFVRFMKMPLEEITRVVDDNGDLTEIHRNFKLTARQAQKLWGSGAGPSVQKALDGNKPFTEFEFLHYAGPRHVRDVSKKDSTNMPIMSLWIAIKDKHLIRESGYQELPFMSEVFYKDSNDPNGFSPAMDVFPEIKLVNAMQKTFIRADMKQSDPAYIVPWRGFTLPLNLNPAATNYRDPKTSKDDIQVMPTGKGKLSMTKDHINMVQDAIKDGLFIFLFRALSDVTKQMTIPEVQQRISENMKILGPVVGRILHGVHDPSIVRLYNMAARAGRLPEPPPELIDADFKVEYLSPLAKAQKQSQIVDIQLYMADLAVVGQVKPSIYDNIDEDKYANVMARFRGVTPEIQRDDELIKRIRAHREEQEQIIASLQAGESIGKTLKDVGAAGKQTAGVGG